MSRYIVSKCLLGYNCKYNGGNNKNEKVKSFCEGNEITLICPECFGGLPIPREPSEIRMMDGEKKVFSSSGKDVTEAFIAGARESLNIAREFNAELCILKESSPSCGANKIYDGTFSGNKIPGMGIAAELLAESGFKVISEEEIENINLN